MNELQSSFSKLIASFVSFATFNGAEGMVAINLFLNLFLLLRFTPETNGNKMNALKE